MRYELTDHCPKWAKVGKHWRVRVHQGIAIVLLCLPLVGATPSEQPADVQGQAPPAVSHQETQTTQPTPTPTTPAVDPGIMVVGELRAIVDALQAVNSEHHAANEQQHADSGSWYSPTVIVQLLLFVVGALYSGFAFLQWKAIRRQADTQSRALSIEQRPWVVATGGGDFAIADGMEAFLNEGEIGISIELRNAGATPALRLTIKLEWNASDWTAEMPNAPQYGQSLTYTIGALGPGITHLHKGLIPLPDAATRQLIQDGMVRFTMCGLVEYGDNLNQALTHTTKFCLLWQASPASVFAISGPYNDCA